jgi:hypothetical protein
VITVDHVSVTNAARTTECLSLYSLAMIDQHGSQ